MPQLQVQRSRVGRASHAQPKPIKRLTLTVTLTVIMFMTVHVESLVMLTSSLVDESVLVRLHLHVHWHVGAVGRREEKVILVASRLPELLRRRILRLRFAFLLAFLIFLWFRGFLDKHWSASLAVSSLVVSSFWLLCFCVWLVSFVGIIVDNSGQCAIVDGGSILMHRVFSTRTT